MSLCARSGPLEYVVCQSNSFFMFIYKKKNKLAYRNGRIHLKHEHQRYGFNRKMPPVLSSQDLGLYSKTFELALLLTVVSEKARKEEAHLMLWMGPQRFSFSRRNRTLVRERGTGQLCLDC